MAVVLTSPMGAFWDPGFSISYPVPCWCFWASRGRQPIFRPLLSTWEIKRESRLHVVARPSPSPATTIATSRWKFSYHSLCNSAFQINKPLILIMKDDLAFKPSCIHNSFLRLAVLGTCCFFGFLMFCFVLFYIFVIKTIAVRSYPIPKNIINTDFFFFIGNIQVDIGSFPVCFISSKGRGRDFSFADSLPDVQGWTTPNPGDRNLSHIFHMRVRDTVYLLPLKLCISKKLGWGAMLGPKPRDSDLPWRQKVMS